MTSALIGREVEPGDHVRSTDRDRGGTDDDRQEVCNCSRSPASQIWTALERSNFELALTSSCVEWFKLIVNRHIVLYSQRSNMKVWRESHAVCPTVPERALEAMDPLLKRLVCHMASAMNSA